MRTLITGGVKSGKSAYALRCAEYFDQPRYFLATAEAFDDEMKRKIARHQEERQGKFITMEEPLAIHSALRENIILDCIPLWLNNMLYYDREADIEAVLDQFLQKLPHNIVIVTNEIGLGFIPVDALSRRYGELLGRINIRLAAACDEVILMVSGLPVQVKSSMQSIRQSRTL